MRGEVVEQVAPIADAATVRSRRINLALAGLLTCVMLTTFVHPYLFRRDEPREAEIARETLIDNHWVTPHLCGLPFLEKPPLYYDLVAVAYAVTGSITPPVARFVSITFGALTVGTVVILGCRWGGARRGWLAALILLGMPEFYKYSHLIVLDIAVAAFVTLAMAAFVRWHFWTTDPHHQRRLLCLFYLAAAGAFLTKGMAGIFHIAVTVTAFCVVTWQWSTFARSLRPLPMLLFAVPVGVWVWLFYREGGMAYLHEHFVNNTVGRLAGVHFQLSTVRFGHTDVGTPREHWFYVGNSLRIFGMAALALPLALWRVMRRGDVGPANREGSQSSPSSRDLLVLLAIWAVLPAVVLSFSANKETSYILPSCTAVALLAAWWLEEQFLPRGALGWQDIGLLAILLPAAALNIFGLQMNVRVYQAVGGMVLAASLIASAVMLSRKQFVAATFGLLGAAVCFVLLTNSPTIDAVSWGFGRTLSDGAWASVGQNELYLYRPDDVARGCVPFFRNRLTPEIDRPGELQAVLDSDRKAFVLIRTEMLERLRREKTMSDAWLFHQLPDVDERHQYILISNPSN